MSKRLVAQAFAIASLAAGSLACSLGAGTPASPSNVPTNTTQSTSSQSVSVKASMPVPLSPASGDRLGGRGVTLVIQNSAGRYVNSQFSYRFQLGNATGATVHESGLITQGEGGQTQYTVPMELDYDASYNWRAQAVIEGKSTDWSGFVNFIGPSPPPPPPPPPPPSPSPAPRTTPTNGAIPRPPGGWPTSGSQIVNLVASRYPEYLDRTSTVGERIEHMEFIRDRVIEVGICSGFDVARNLKRGVGPHSHDAIAWDVGGRGGRGRVEVVDIASAFDDNRSVLRLHWVIVAGPPGYDPLPWRVQCQP